jgi:hypothetical protein
MRYEIITACNDILHAQYADKSISTWQTTPIIYWQGDVIDPRWDQWRIMARDYETGRFERECVRFSHKVQAQITHMRKSTADYVIWLDADVIQHTHYTESEFEALLPGPEELFTFLDRQPVKYAETGWIAYNMHHPRLKEFLRRLEDMYLTRELFGLPQTHDAYVWDHIRQRGNYPGRNLLHKAKSSEPFDDSDLGAWFRHHKGQRKAKIK